MASFRHDDDQGQPFHVSLDAGSSHPSLVVVGVPMEEKHHVKGPQGRIIGGENRGRRLETQYAAEIVKLKKSHLAILRRFGESSASLSVT
jgi:hypothetical protein